MALFSSCGQRKIITNLNIQKVKRTVGERRFSILIPTWNNLAYLRLIVNSIRSNSTFRHQIIVHINEGKDGTLEWVRSQHDLDYTYSEENIGICYALNIASTLLDTDYVVYMNDDMYVCPGWDDELMKEIIQIGHQDFFISGTAIEPVNTSNNSVIVKNYGADIAGFQEARLLEEFSGLPMDDWQGATWPPNVVHRNNWDLVGGYSIEFSPGMYSDPDFSMKLWLAGIRLFKGVAKCRVYHFGSKSTRKVTKNKGYYTFISKWGISPSTLTQHFLKSGTPFDGPLSGEEPPRMIQWKNLYKRLESSLKPRK